MKKSALIIVVVIYIVCAFAFVGCGNSVGSLEFSEVLNQDGDIVGYSVSDIGTYNSPELKIPKEYKGKPVLAIDDKAFKDCTKIKKVTVPNTVTSIGEGAFTGCGNIEIMELPFIGGNKGGTVNSHFGYIFGENKYSSGVETEEITLNNGDKKIYYLPQALKKVTITAEGIYNGAFSGCGSIKNITLPKNIEVVPEECFHRCYSLEKIEIPESVKTIEARAFVGCSAIREIIIPEGTTTIGDYSFGCCMSLLSATLPKTLKNVGEGIFNICPRLVEVYNYSNLTISKDGENCDICADVSDVYTKKTKSNIVYMNDYVFYDSREPQLIAYFGESKELNLPINYKQMKYAIRQYAFVLNDKLTRVKISNGVTKIGDYAFNFCSELTDVEIGSFVTQIGRGAFSGCSKLNFADFLNKENWSVVKYDASSEPMIIQIDELGKKRDAAKYLKTTYCDYYWQCG